MASQSSWNGGRSGLVPVVRSRPMSIVAKRLPISANAKYLLEQIKRKFVLYVNVILYINCHYYDCLGTLITKISCHIRKRCKAEFSTYYCSHQ